ncbi:TetR/AcrR family transcriptional regulator [Candidatus Rhodoluna planktonica]|uniref:HTH tetR-type domain-containing protein n=1 Tax=Candidatus Rhodoluna planktonica TaxID=535712 RepID=A0A1D9E0K0_9MICO|nr:TetR/AcrR family transcriptional regulator [Candidatus Rhodoluna planktonica]AOY56592.1 hypothetical protein A4Z71_06535 [Candidatus Rhodoluna planktonica]
MVTAKSDERRKAILRASIDLVSEHGAEWLTMARIGEATGLSRSAIYQYFESKDHVLGELLIDDMADLSNEIDRIVASVNDPMEQIRIWIHYSLAHLASADHLVVREISMTHLREEQRGELMAMHGFFLTTLHSPLIQLGVSDPTSLGSMIFGAVNSAAQRIYSGKSFIHEAATLEKFVIAGIEAAI